MKVELKGDELIIKLKVNNPLTESKSGKSLTVATTGGNKPTSVEVEGQTLYVGVNAYISKP